MRLSGLIPIALALLLSPLLLGVINRTKAVFAGRRGQPLLQLYFDLWKLLHKGAIYSRTTTWIFRANPVISLAAMLTALTLLPFGDMPSLIGFSGDLILLGCLLGVIRFMLVSAALDTGSSFEGMGASREVQFSALAEPALLLSLAVFAHKTLYISLRDMFAAMGFFDWYQSPASLFMALAALIVVMLAENARIPVDDPNTHLELTMIHEVMVLDYTGPDLAFVLYTAALKLWLFGAVIIGLFLPIHSDHALLNLAVGLMGMFGIAVLVGTVESVMARLRLLNVPQLLVGASALAVVALALMLR